MREYKVMFFLWIGISSCGNHQTEITAIKDSSITLPDSIKTILPKQDSIIVEKKYTAIDSTKKYIYLTFDDGPQNGTLTCYNICEELGVKGTFFMIGEQVRDKWGKNLKQKIQESYPATLLANHSYTHAFNNKYKKFYRLSDSAYSDFKRAQDSLKPNYKIARLPGNSGWAIQNKIRSSHFVKAVINKLDSSGYDVIGWDVEWNFSYDGKSRPVQSANTIIGYINYALNHHASFTKKHVVLLAHDRMFREKVDADSLRYVIQELKKNKNYIFETMDHYPGLKLNSSN